MNQVMISVKDKSSYSELCIIKYKKLIPIVNYFDTSVTHPYSTQAKIHTPTLNLTSKNNLTKMMLIVDISITQEYDYFLKVKKTSFFEI